MAPTNHLHDKYKISVLIPYYKADEFFAESIDSVRAQTFPVSEIIIVNDNSGAESERFLQRYADVARVIHLHSRHGAAGTRNVALAAATCPWIAFQDADDIWELNKLERQVDLLEENADWDGCHTGVVTFNESGILACYNDKPSPLTVDDLLMGSHVTPTSLMLKKKVLDDLGNFDTQFRTSSDFDFSIRVAKAGYKIGFVPEPLIRMRRENHGNVSSNGFRTFKSHLKLVRKHRDVYSFNTARRFLANSLRASAGKVGGFRGRIVYRLGQLLGI